MYKLTESKIVKHYSRTQTYTITHTNTHRHTHIYIYVRIALETAIKTCKTLLHWRIWGRLNLLSILLTIIN